MAAQDLLVQLLRPDSFQVQIVRAEVNAHEMYDRAHSALAEGRRTKVEFLGLLMSLLVFQDASRVSQVL